MVITPMVALYFSRQRSLNIYLNISILKFEHQLSPSIGPGNHGFNHLESTLSQGDCIEISQFVEF